MRYIVLGAGAIGSALGGMLSHTGREAVLVGRPHHTASILQNGLVITHADREINVSVPIVNTLSLLAPSVQDVILLTVKTQDTPTALAQIKAWTDLDLPIVCLQNGVRNEELAKEEFSQVIAALVNFNATFITPGRIQRTLWNVVGLGLYPQGINSLVENIAQDLQQAGFELHCREEIMRAKWGKLIANLNNATNAITNNSLQQALANDEHRLFMAEVMAEGVRVVEQVGIALDDGGLFDVRAMINAFYQPSLAKQPLPVPAEEHSYPSTWQDLLLGRKRTEASFFNGEIIKLAQPLGLNTPYNSTLLNLIETMAAKGEKPGRYNLADLKAMVSARNT